MNQETENKISAIIGQLRDELKSLYPDFRGIYFFGSRARGDYNDYSDVDLALLFDRNIDWPFEKEVISTICRYDIEYDIIIDSHIFDYRDLIEPKTPFRENIKAEGVYYDA
jgi:predicted nucleotidyltransferase